MANENQYEQLDRYLDGAMPEEEHQAFEAALEQDEQMQKALLLQRDLRAGIDQLGHTALRDRLRQIHQEEVRGHEAPIVPLRSDRGLWRRWAAVAALLVAAVGLLYWAVNRNELAPGDLYASHYEPYPLSLTQRGASEQLAQQQAETAYLAGDYATALPLLQRLIQADPNDGELVLATAIAEWETGKVSEALTRLQGLEGNALLKDRAFWYQAMIHLKNEDWAAAKTALGTVAADEGSRFVEPARELLDQLGAQ